jgi:hypothetical protein
MTTPPSSAARRLSGWWPVFRAAGALLILAAIVAQLQRTIEIALTAATPHGSHLPTVITNFFSFFTIESNVLSVLGLGAAAVWSWTHRGTAAHPPLWLTVLLTAATAYMLVTGVVYNTLLRGIPLPQGQTVLWSNEVLHVVGPVLMLIDLLFAPRGRALRWSALWVVIAFPVVWAVYTLVRANTITAPSTGNAWWYPYPFLDPHQVPGGYAGVAGYILLIAAIISAFAWFTVWYGRRAGRRFDADAGVLPPTGRSSVTQ